MYTADIIAEISNIERFDSQVKYTNLYWKKSQSGELWNRNEHQKPWQATNIYVITMLKLPNRCNEMSLFTGNTLKKYQEVPKYKHKRALVMTAGKLIRLVEVLLRNNQLHTSERSV